MKPPAYSPSVCYKFVKDVVNDSSSNKEAGGEIPLKILKKCENLERM